MGLSFRSAGESHGPGLVALLEGLPMGLRYPAERVAANLKRRREGYGRSARQRDEDDAVEVVAGLRDGRSLGSPLALLLRNRDQSIDERPPITRPRPGHADLAGALRLGARDARGVAERASARETAARVAAGAVALELLAAAGIEVHGYVMAIGPIEADVPEDLAVCLARRKTSPVYAPHPDAALAMTRLIDELRAVGDSLGGVAEVRARGLPPGLGSCEQWDRRLDGLLAQALMSIPSAKAVELGLGRGLAHLKGSQAHDPIERTDPALTGLPFRRPTNWAGGLEGGMTNGEELVLRVAFKPIPTIMRPLPSVDLVTGEAAPAAVERADVCAVPAASVVAEAVTALVLAGALIDRYGGATLDELLARVQVHRGLLRDYFA